MRTIILRFAGDASALNRTLSDVEGRVGQAGSSMRNAGAKMTAGVTLPLLGIAGAAINTAMQYEKSMNVLKAASGATGAEMKQFGALARQLGADAKLPGTSAADAAEAMTELSKAGLKIGEVMGATKGVLQLAAAGELENAEAAQIAAGALNAFGLKGTEATRVADLLAGAANSSQGSVNDMALALQDGGAVFADAKIPLEDLVTMVAMLAKKGVGGAVAGTALKTMIQRLQKPLGPAAGALEELGKRIGQTSLSIYDSKGRIKPTTKIIEEFSRATAGLTDEKRGNLLATIFGADGIKGATGVLTAGVGAFQTIKGEVTKLGEAEKMAKAQTEGLTGAIDAIKSPMETLAIEVVAPLLTKITPLFLAIASFIPTIGDLPKPVMMAAAAFAAVLAVAGPLLFVFGAMLSPIGLIATAMAVAAGAIGAAMNPAETEAFVAKVKAKWNELAPGVGAAISRFVATAKAWITTNGPVIAAQLMEWGRAFVAWIGPMIPPFLAALGGLLTRIGSWIVVNGPVLARQLAAWAQAFIEWIVPMIPPFLTALGGFLSDIGTWIVETAVPVLAQQLRDNWIPAFVGWVTEIGGPLLKEFGILLKDILTWILFDAGPAIGKAFLTMAAAIPIGLAKSIPNVLMGGDGKDGKKPSSPAAAGKGGANKALDFITGPIGGFLGFAKGGALLGVNRPTPVMIGEGRGKEDMLAVPHSKGGLAGFGGFGSRSAPSYVMAPGAVQVTAGGGSDFDRAVLQQAVRGAVATALAERNWGGR